MNFIDIKEQLPYDQQLVVIKTSIAAFDYHTCRYCAYKKLFMAFNSHWSLDSVISWAPIKDTENQNIVHCKDCRRRYNELECPIAGFVEWCMF